ncbi:MAG TPA: hypothetical protein VG125_29160 [Pirellulales bacterium]|jgi:hypothetical protein|nr:hypothetical protein [Pirellulales bacterium]
MLAWLKKLDDKLFSPPHRFGTLLTFVAVYLSLYRAFDAQHSKGGKDESRQVGDAPAANHAEGRVVE